jgi:hypothetical protein
VQVLADADSPALMLCAGQADADSPAALRNTRQRDRRGQLQSAVSPGRQSMAKVLACCLCFVVLYPL